MTPEEYRLALEAAKMPLADRAAYLKENCPQALRSFVERLVSAHKLQMVSLLNCTTMSKIGLRENLGFIKFSQKSTVGAWARSTWASEPKTIHSWSPSKCSIRHLGPTVLSVSCTRGKLWHGWKIATLPAFSMGDTAVETLEVCGGDHAGK